MKATNICLLCGEQHDFTPKFTGILNDYLLAEDRVKAAVSRVIAEGSIAITELQRADADLKAAELAHARFDGDKYVEHVCPPEARTQVA